jgi:hypothetical protein
MQEVEGAWSGIFQQQQSAGAAQDQDPGGSSGDAGSEQQGNADEDVVDAEFEEQ